MSALAELLADSGGLLKRVQLERPQPLALRRAVQALTGASVVTADPERTAALQLRVATLIRAGEVDRVTRRDVREACRTVLQAPLIPAGEPDLRAPLLARVERTHHRAALFALLDAYLDGYAQHDAAVRALAASLAQMVGRWPWRTADLWPGRLSRYRLLAIDEAPARIADAILESDAPQPVLESCGLTVGGRGKGGLSEAAFAICCDRVAGLPLSRAPAVQRMLLAWNGDHAGTGAFAGAWPRLANACLAAWEEHDPEEDHRSFLIDRLELLGGGDPRVVRNSRWARIETDYPRALNVLLDWLTGISVMQFLEIVDRSLRDQDARRMWAYRRAFWTYYLKNEGGPRIERAWVAFGEEGGRLARATALETGNRGLTAFGNHSDRSGQHAALLMRIGDLLIVDWSHSGKYNVWRRGQGGPRLFEKRYVPGELDSAPLRDSHGSAHTYSWQKKLAGIIENRTFFAERPEWRPKHV